MAILYPKCPQCGGTCETDEPTDFDQSARGMGALLRSAAAAGHPHPYMKAVQLAAVVGRQVYKRWPGGGQKRCTACSHSFR